MALLNEDYGRFKTYTRRAAMLAGGKTVLLAALVGRLYELQVLDRDKYSTLAEDNRISLRLLPPPRGRILDRFGQPLAVNEQNYRVMLVAEQADDVEATLDKLARIIRIPEVERARILREVRNKRSFVPVTVRENLSWDRVSRIEVNAPDLAGISMDVGQTRAYPYGKDMAHVLGYVGAVSKEELDGTDPLLELPGFRVGKSGMEQRYDTSLRGSAGSSQVEVNAVGRTIRELSRTPGEPGNDLVLSIDAELQALFQQRLSGEKSASGVLMDTLTGDVLAMASVPSYNPNAFNLGMSSKDWRDLVNDPLNPLTNKAVGGLYNPGSTFKMVVALAALEAGIDPAQEVFCPGYYELGRARFHCWKRHGHGHMDMIAGIKHSCDVYYYDVARRLGIDAIAATARRFGLGETSGIELSGERGGTIPTEAWKQTYIGEPWQGGETLVSAIGQGFVLTTPLQLAVMTSRIASGRAVQPRLTRRLLDNSGTVVQPLEERVFPELQMSKRHLDIVRNGMDAVVNEPGGTAFGKRIRQDGMHMAGKTGTAQVRRITMAERREGVISNDDLPWRQRDHALFVSFAPVEAPRYCCAVVVEHGGGGSTTAAPIVHDIMLATQKRDPANRPEPASVAGGLQSAMLVGDPSGSSGSRGRR
jgi:penicillin-binding protein 2